MYRGLQNTERSRPPTPLSHPHLLALSLRDIFLPPGMQYLLLVRLGNDGPFEARFTSLLFSAVGRP